MAVVKLTASKKGIGFIDDDGNYFITSSDFVRKLLAGEWKGSVILLKRLPTRVDSGRFLKSPVWELEKPLPSLEELRIEGRQDLLDAGKKLADSKQFEDRVVL